MGQTALFQQLTSRRVEWRALAFIRAVRGAFIAGIALALFVFPLASMANTTTGLVVAIADGDTLTLLDADSVQHNLNP